MSDIEPKAPLFLETTILIWRLFSTHQVKREIAATLEGWRCISSSYVYAEYLNTVLRAAVDIHNVVVAAEDVEDALGRWDARWSGRYKLGIRLLLLAWHQDEYDRESVLRRLRYLIRTRIPNEFTRTVDEGIDVTHCSAAGCRPQFRESVFELDLDFPPGTAPEGLQRFLAAQDKALRRLEAALPEGGKHWLPVRAGLQSILREEYRLGKRMWERLADVVIALAARLLQAELYSGNVRHFEPLCNSLDVSFLPQSLGGPALPSPGVGE